MNNNTTNNDYAIDLAHYYGFSTGSPGGFDASVNYHPNLPSLEQIASYNLQQARAEAAMREVNTSQTMPSQGASSLSMGSSAMNSNTTGMLSAPGTGATSYPSQDMGMTQDMSSQPILEYNQPYPITAESIQYLNGFIRSQVGRNVSIEFLVGTNQIVTKEGFLVAVGANFILLNQKGTNDILACDFYNIKFITFYY